MNRQIGNETSAMVVQCIFFVQALTSLPILDSLIFVDRHQVQILGTVIPHGPLRKGQPVKSHYEQRKATKTPCVSSSSHFWQSEIRHQGLDKELLEDAAQASADIVKKKANDFKACKRSAASNPEGVLEQQQELAGLRKEAYYWSKMAKAIKFMELHPEKVYPPPTKHIATWKNHQVEEEPARLEISHLLEALRQDPGKILACGGGDPGLKTTLEVVPQTFDEVLVHLNRYLVLTGKPEIPNVKAILKEYDPRWCQ